MRLHTLLKKVRERVGKTEGNARLQRRVERKKGTRVKLGDIRAGVFGL